MQRRSFESNLALLDRYKDSFCDDENVLELDERCWWYNIMKCTKISSELYSLKWLIICYVNFTSTKKINYREKNNNREVIDTTGAWGLQT